MNKETSKYTINVLSGKLIVSKDETTGATELSHTWGGGTSEPIKLNLKNIEDLITLFNSLKSIDK